MSCAGAREALPRFLVQGLHRNLTLLAVVFVFAHVVTTIADGFAPIGLQDAIFPFLSPYRPIWLGLGTVAFDLLLALTITSLVRARLGLKTWRAVHWLAYASWPIALVHSFGTGSDARVGWMALLGFGCAGLVALAALARVVAARDAAPVPRARRRGSGRRRPARALPLVQRRPRRRRLGLARGHAVDAARRARRGAAAGAVHRGRARHDRPVGAAVPASSRSRSRSRRGRSA